MERYVPGEGNFEIAANLRNMIADDMFNEDVREKLKPQFDPGTLKFLAVNPAGTDVLSLSIDRDSKTAESGVAVLKSLVEVITADYAKRVGIKTNEINNRIRYYERCIGNAREKMAILQEELKQIGGREYSLKEELQTLKAHTAEILNFREGLLKQNTSPDMIHVLLFTNFLQNNISYSNQLNNQFSDLIVRKGYVNLEARYLDAQISDYQSEVELLKERLGFISNLKEISQPTISSRSSGPGIRKTMILSVLLGVIWGVAVISFQEFWVRRKTAGKKS
jgi:hypothetical protein